MQPLPSRRTQNPHSNPNHFHHGKLPPATLELHSPEMLKTKETLPSWAGTAARKRLPARLEKRLHLSHEGEEAGGSGEESRSAVGGSAGSLDGAAGVGAGGGARGGDGGGLGLAGDVHGLVDDGRDDSGDRGLDGLD